MVFSSLIFLIIFLPVLLLLYYSCPTRWRNVVLLCGSLVFYAWGEPVYIVLLLLSTTADYFFGRALGKRQSNERHRKWLVAGSVLINLAVLGFFKYADFIIENLNALLGSSIEALELPLPIGISFYTFQSISYIVDVYRRKVEPQQSWLSFAVYISLFPQLVAGPIVQYGTIAAQLGKRMFSEVQFAEGIARFIRGLAKKVLLANNIGLLWEQISSQQTDQLAIAMAWLGIIAFAFQIYFDFSGYSDMAIGLGLMFGFRFNENFNLPYRAASITEFWRRWHISLGSWFKEYVYIPLGGNRQGLMKQLRNILIVWTLTGIWHGASWNFVLWGLYFALILTLEKLFMLKLLARCPRILQHSYAILLILLGWVIFVFEDLQQMSGYFTAMLGLQHHAVWLDEATLYQLSNYIVLLAILVVCAVAPRFSVLERFKISMTGALVSWGVHMALLLLCIAYLVDASFNPFLYFRF